MFGLFKRKPVASMTSQEAHDLAERNEIRLVDVREANEWAAGHIAGAAHAPLSALAEHLATIPTDRPLVFYCISGKRSATAIAECRRLGLPHDRHMPGGIVEWRQAGFPFAK